MRDEGLGINSSTPSIPLRGVAPLTAAGRAQRERWGSQCGWSGRTPPPPYCCPYPCPYCTEGVYLEGGAVVVRYRDRHGARRGGVGVRARDRQPARRGAARGRQHSELVLRHVRVRARLLRTKRCRLQSCLVADACCSPSERRGAGPAEQRARRSPPPLPTVAPTRVPTVHSLPPPPPPPYCWARPAEQRARRSAARQSGP
jgi:hypothetical protein